MKSVAAVRPAEMANSVMRNFVRRRIFLIWRPWAVEPVEKDEERPEVGLALSIYEINKGFTWRERAVSTDVETETVLEASNGLSTAELPWQRRKRIRPRAG